MSDPLHYLITGLFAGLGCCASALSVNVTGTWAHCPDYADGTATANASGGTEPYTYLWNTGATTQTITDLVPGAYSCTVTDGVGTTANDTYPIQEAAQYLHFGVLGVDPACDGGCSGLMRFDTTQCPGVGPYTLSPPPDYWIGDVGYYPNLCPWSFAFQVGDATGCVEDVEVPVGNQDNLTGQLEATTPGCNGAPNGSASFSIGLSGPPPGVGGPLMFSVMSGGNLVQTFELWVLSEQYSYTTVDYLAPGDYTLEASSTGYCLPAYLNIPFTVPDMGPDCGTVQGIVWYDLDHDCVIDGSEPRLANRVNTILPGPRYAITTSSGFYSVGLDFGSYTITQNSADLDQICPAASPVPFTLASGNALASINLGDTSNIAFDLRTDCFLDVARPGFDVNAWMRVENGSVYPSDAVALAYTYDAPLEFVSADVAPTVNTPGYLEWQLPAIGGYGGSTVHLVFTLPPDPGLIGTMVNTSATATNAGAESQTGNNSCSSSRTITAAFDPNDKTARTSSGLSGTQYFLDEDNSVTYTIRFQNTGTDTAFAVVLRDTLEVDLDPGTLEILGSSHAFEPSFETGRVLVFTFGDILLPDSGANEAASHGFVRFRIEPREDIALGDVLSNSASIYFDFNPPVITNTSELLVELSTQVRASGQDQAGLRVFPNPVGDALGVAIDDPLHKVFSADVLGFDGRVVLRVTMLLSGETIATRELAAGVYTLRLTDTDGGSHLARFVKH